MIHKHGCSRFVVLISCWAELPRVVTVYCCCFQKKELCGRLFFTFFSPRYLGNPRGFWLCWYSLVQIQDFQWMKFITFQGVTLHYSLWTAEIQHNSAANFGFCVRGCMQEFSQGRSWARGVSRNSETRFCPLVCNSFISSIGWVWFLCCGTRKWIADTTIS